MNVSVFRRMLNLLSMRTIEQYNSNVISPRLIEFFMSFDNDLMHSKLHGKRPRMTIQKKRCGDACHWWISKMTIIRGQFFATW